MPYKTFTNTNLTATEVNTYLMNQAIITCTSSTRPASPVNGWHIYETDTLAEYVWTGAAWRMLSRGGDLPPTSWGGGGSTAWSIPILSSAGRYTIQKGWVTGQARFIASTTGPYVNVLGLDLPTTPQTIVVGLMMGTWQASTTYGGAMSGWLRFNTTYPNEPDAIRWDNGGQVGGQAYFQVAANDVFTYQVSYAAY